jgi:2-C-methyl-D-erythritol 4-phosphate cytidylyltransferase
MSGGFFISGQIIVICSMKKYAVIVAAGSGIRMGGNTPKQFLLVNNKPVLYYTLQTFLNAFADIQIILVLPVDFTDCRSSRMMQ